MISASKYAADTDQIIALCQVIQDWSLGWKGLDQKFTALGAEIEAAQAIGAESRNEIANLLNLDRGFDTIEQLVLSKLEEFYQYLTEALRDVRD